MNAGSGSKDGRAEREAGAVLVVVVLVMLATFGLGHGLLLAARFELLAARAGARQLELRAAAQTAGARALAGGGGAWMDSVAPWHTGPTTSDSIGSIRTEASFRRLAPESWLVESWARRAAGPTVRAARLAWTMDPLERVLDLHGVVAVRTDAPVEITGTIEAGVVAAALPPLTASMCAPLAAPQAARLSSLPPVAALDSSILRPGLGELSFDQLLALAPQGVQGTGTPAPVERLGVCVDGAWSWGDPERPFRACGAELPLRAATADLVVDGGIGQGVLLVDGDIVLAGGGRYYGLVLATGVLDVREGAELTGYAVAAGGLSVASGSRIVGSACWAERALRANRALLSVAVPRAEPIGPL